MPLHSRRTLLAALAALPVLGCRRLPAAAPSMPVLPPKLLGELVATPPGAVGAYRSHRWSFSTMSYWIEGPTGLVVIDTQFLPTAAEHFVDLAEATTGKTVELAIVLHANPDKFNGTAALQARGIRVVTSKQVLALIADVHRRRLRAFGERYAPVYPTITPAPDSFGDKRTTLRAAGLEIELVTLGPGCSEAHVAALWNGQLFTGDLVAKAAHSWLEIGRTQAWIERIAELEALNPIRVHSGRGGSGGPGLLQAQRAYLELVIGAVAAEGPTLPMDPKGLARARATIEQHYPEHDWAVFLGLGLPAEWRRQAMQAAKP